jgi:environmental stress-induced protein Ves
VTCSTNSYALGGTVSGLQGSGLTLQNHGGDDLVIAADGAYTFAGPVASGATWAVTVSVQPTSPWQTCAVTNGSGTVEGAAIEVVVTCTTNSFAIGGTVSGLEGTGLILQNNGGDDLLIGADGTFAFPIPVASGAAYAVTVSAQPASPWQTCAVTNGSGTLAGAAIADVTVTCTINSYALGGTVSGLQGSGLTLQNHGGDDLVIAADGAFTFAGPVASGATWAVTVSVEPTNPWQTCAVTNGSGRRPIRLAKSSGSHGR